MGKKFVVALGCDGANVKMRVVKQPEVWRGKFGMAFDGFTISSAYHPSISAFILHINGTRTEKDGVLVEESFFSVWHAEKYVADATAAIRAIGGKVVPFEDEKPKKPVITTGEWKCLELATGWRGVAAAKDADGRVFVFEEVPAFSGSVWRSDGDLSRAQGLDGRFADIAPADSLVLRG